MIGGQRPEDFKSPEAPLIKGKNSILEIDGSMLEGGGQILRITAALCAICGHPVRILNIRAKRSKPGLRPQHLAGLQLVAEVCDGELQGGKVGSCEVTLLPSQIRGGNFQADPGTAGSCCLMVQVALPVLLFANSGHEASASGRDMPALQQEASSSGRDEQGPAEGAPPVRLRLSGGTDADMAPPVGYQQHVLFPVLRKLWGLRIEDNLIRRGFFPKGGGLIELDIWPLPPGKPLQAISLTERGRVTAISIKAFTAGGVRKDIAERMTHAAKAALQKGLGKSIPISWEMEHYTTSTNPAAVADGAGILIVAETETGCILAAAAPGKRGVSSEQVGSQAAEELLEDLSSGGCADRWLEDQLIIFMALAEGKSTFTCRNPSLHTRTAMAVAEMLSGASFRVLGPRANQGEAFYTITCQGIGMKR